MATKKIYGKDNGIFFYHYAQSFSPTEKLTPEQAHEVSLEFAEKAWPGQEVMVATHCDADHIHSHFVINSVGFESGMKLRQSPSTLKPLRKLSDEICIAHGLTVLDPYEGGGNRVSTREYRARMKGESWKQKLAEDIDKAMEFSGSRDEFERAMSILGYRMTWTNERKYLTFHCPNGRSCRDKNLHDDKYLKNNIENEFSQRAFPVGCSEQSQPTGWEDSRELYEQHLRERAVAKTEESQKISDSYSPVENDISGNIGSLAGAASRIIDDDNEDPEERRKRIEAQENSAAIGALIGAGIGIVKSITDQSTEESSEQEPGHSAIIDRQREEILYEAFEEDEYDDEYYDEDEDEGFIMSM